MVIAEVLFGLILRAMIPTTTPRCIIYKINQLDISNSCHSLTPPEQEETYHCAG